MWLSIAVSAILFIVDQASKVWACHYLPSFDLSSNSMISFGTIMHVNESYIAPFIGFLFIMGWWTSKMPPAALVLITGGGLSNIFDMTVSGQVPDFLGIRMGDQFIIANLADIFITSGMLYCTIGLILNVIKWKDVLPGSKFPS